MNNFTNFKSFKFLYTAFTLLAFVFLTSCGGDDEATPDCGSLELSATVEGNTITASVDGGAAPYQFSLNSGATQSNGNFTDLEPGTYAVEVTDANECTDSQSLQVIDPCANFSVSATASAYEITIALTSGEAPFEYTINYGDQSLTGTSDVRSFTIEVEEAAATEINITDAAACVVEAELTADAIRTFTDSRDGQEYLTIKIGEQIWFAENFNYNTNTADSTSSWYYDDDSVANSAEYGRLYTWYVAQEIAPEGWALPTTSNYEALENEIDGTPAEVGAALRQGGRTGFEAKLGGRRLQDESYVGLNIANQLWTSSQAVIPEDGNNVVVWSENDNGGIIEFTSTFKVRGLSIRLIKL